jgi:hypothetical protein
MALPRYLNTFFKHWPLYLLPPLIIAGMLVAFSFTLKPKYTSAATVWVEQSAFLDASLQRGSNDGSSYDTPSTTKANVLNEYLKTRSFVRDVIRGTSYRGYLGDPTKEGDLITDIMTNASASTNGYNSFTITYSNTSATRSYEFTKSVLDNFLLQQREEIKRTGDSTIQLLQSQIASAQKDLDKAESDLREMLSRYPCAPTTNLTDRALTQEDLQCQVLIQKRDAARTTLDGLTKNLSGTKESYTAALDGRDINLRVVDQPETFESTTSNKLLFVLFGLGGFLVGVVLSVLAIVAITWTDNTVRLRTYGAKLFDPTKVFELPQVKTLRPKKVKGGGVIASPDVKQRMIAQLKWAQDNSLKLEERH